MDDLTPQLTWRVTSTHALVHGPIGRLPTRRVPSRDVRPVAERPGASGRVVLPRQVRKLCGAHGRCPRRLFTARLAPLVTPWARRTPRLRPGLTPIAMALGGRAGVRRGRPLGLASSRHTRRHLRRQLPLPDVATPHGLGVDAWAYRKRQTSGTVLSDRARRRPLARWPAREATTCALGLQAHPGGGVSPRERSSAEADGARHGAPDAIQVAERWHLLPNLAAALAQVWNAHRSTREASHAVLHQAPVARPDGTVAVPVPPPPPPCSARDLAHHRQAPRRALHQQLGGLHQPGWLGWASAQPLGLGTNTVDRARRTATWPARQRRAERGRSRRTPDPASRLDRWNAGHRDAWRRCRELQPRG
jgi:hypothetical protein